MSTQKRDQSRLERAQEIRAERVRKERNRRIWAIVGIVVVISAVVAAGSWYSGASAPTAVAATPKVVATANGIMVGDNAAAPVKVTIYEDFLCPYCRELEMSTRDLLHQDAAKGKVLVEYRPVNLLSRFPYSARAMNAWAAVLKHGTPLQALKLHDLFYDNQPYEESSNQISDSQIADWVKAAGAGSAAVTGALQTPDTAFFTAAQQSMIAAKIVGTPTVFVNGRLLVGTSMVDLAGQIESAIEKGNS